MRDYPLEAVREVLLNTIVHRDYGYSGSTIVNIFSDRMEFVSLGGLVSGLSLEAILVGASQSRNERLASLFYRMRLIEAYGTGVGKIVGGYADSWRKPTFEPVEGAFRVTLPKRDAEPVSGPVTYAKEPAGTYAVNSRQRMIRFLRSMDMASRSELEGGLQLGTTRVLQLLGELVNEGVVLKQGSGRNTRYRLRRRETGK